MPRLGVPVILMSYLNPLLAVGLEALSAAPLDAGVCGFIVPDLPLDESDDFRAALEPRSLALIQMVTPVTSAERLARLCDASQGFVYAVTMTGTTGRNVAVPEAVLEYLDRVRARARIPVCAGFGIRSREQVARLAGHVDGVIVGSALVEVLERDADPAAWLGTLRASRAMSEVRTTFVEEARTHRGLAVLLAALATVSPFSIDTFFPSFPAIAAQFALNTWQMQQTLTSYLVPFAIMSLVLGPLSDALGRRPIVLVGLAVYSAGIDRLCGGAKLCVASHISGRCRA